MSMNNLRRTIFFLLMFYISAVASQQVTAVDSTFQLDIRHIDPSETSNFTVAVFPNDTTLLIQFNISNLTDNTVAVNNDVFNLTNNLTVNFIMPNGTEVEVARNFTDVASFHPILSGTNLDNIEWSFDFTVTLNDTIIPDQEGDYIVNITVDVYNTSGYFNGSQSFTGLVLQINNAGPNVVIKTRDRLDNEKTTFQATDLVKIVCTRSSAVGNYNETNITIKPPRDNFFSLVSEDFTRSTTSSDFTVDFTATEELGDYVAMCFSIDDYGLMNVTENITFTVVKKPPRSSSAFANKDFQAPVGKKIITGSEDLGKVSEAGDSRQIRKGANVKVNVKGESHTITVKALSPTEVTLTVESTPQEVVIKKGETLDVDVDQDGQNDLAITYHQQIKTGERAAADITLKTVATPAEPKKDTTKEPPKVDEKEGILAGGSGSLIVVVIVIIAIVVIGFALIRGKKK